MRDLRTSSLRVCRNGASSPTEAPKSKSPNADQSGRNVQNAAMDLLLKMMRDLPGSLDYLRARAA